MIQSIIESPLYRIANPRSIAFFGASNNFSAMGTSILGSLQAQGFDGPVYPVHPKDDEILGLTAYRDVRDLPEVPDLAVMVLPTAVVPTTRLPTLRSARPPQGSHTTSRCSTCTGRGW